MSHTSLVLSMHVCYGMSPSTCVCDEQLLHLLTCPRFVPLVLSLRAVVIILDNLRAVVLKQQVGHSVGSSNSRSSFVFRSLSAVACYAMAVSVLCCGHAGSVAFFLVRCCMVSCSFGSGYPAVLCVLLTCCACTASSCKLHAKYR
jgi:hypothetical protein